MLLDEFRSQERRLSYDLSKLPSVRIERGRFFAEIITDRRTRPALYHTIIQATDSKDIVFWSQDSTLDQATRLAESQLDYLCRPREQAA